MEQWQINDEVELVEETVAMMDNYQDEDYDAAISRLLLPPDDDFYCLDRTESSTDVAHVATPISPNLGQFQANSSFSGEVTPEATLALTTATSSFLRKIPVSSTQQAKRKKIAPVTNLSTSKKRRTASHNSNRARDERKEELIYLRKTVHALEARLRTLRVSQRRVLAMPAPLSSKNDLTKGESNKMCLMERASTMDALRGQTGVTKPPFSHDNMKEDAAMEHVWTDIAAHQYQERRRVELENIRLKLILDGQIKMAKSLERMLTKRISLRVMESIQGKYLYSLQHRKPASTENEDETAIFSRLNKDLATALNDVDTVFEANGLACMDKTYADAQVRHENGTTVMEIFANKVVPFEVEATSHAVWEHFVNSMDHIPSRFVYHKQLKPETTNDMLVESFGLELVGSRNATAAFFVRQIRRKYVQPHRVVIAWPMYSEALELSAEPTKGVRLHEKCFTVVKAFPNAGGGRRGALIQTCYLLRPDINDRVADRERILNALTDFLLDSVSHTISSSHQMIENYLLDKALQFEAKSSTLR